MSYGMPALQEGFRRMGEIEDFTREHANSEDLSHRCAERERSSQILSR